MGHLKNEKPALLIIDMVRDNFIESKKLPITPFAVNIIGPLNRLIRVCRKHQWPVVFSTDAFNQEYLVKENLKVKSPEFVNSET